MSFLDRRKKKSSNGLISSRFDAIGLTENYLTFAGNFWLPDTPECAFIDGKLK